jgi:hypothetical protein
MYAVVGCSDCSALWVVTTDGESAGCPRCGTRHRLDTLEKFVTTPAEDHARDVRASMLAARQGEEEAFATVDDFATLDDRAETEAVPDETYLAASGIDPDAVEAAGERTTAAGSAGKDRQTLVRDAIESLESPSADDIVAVAREGGVPEEVTRELLDRMVEHGLVSEHNGTYRLL